MEVKRPEGVFSFEDIHRAVFGGQASAGKRQSRMAQRS